MAYNPYTYQTTTTTTTYGYSPTQSLFMFGALVLSVVGLWKIFVKAGQPGWAAVVPFYNVYVLLQVIGRPGWWLILLFIPFVNIVFSLIIALDLAKVFGKSGLFGFVALWLFAPIGLAVLGFSDAKYTKPKMQV